MLKFGQLGIPSGLFSLMREHQLRLLGLSSCSSLLNLTLTVVKVFSFLVKLGLEVKHLSFLL